MVNRRYSIWAAVCLSLGATAWGGGPESHPTQPPLRIEENSIVYAGQRLMLGSPLDEWKRAFGEPSRFVDRIGGIYVWDTLGIAVLLRLPFSRTDPHVAAFRVFFTQREVDFWPRSAYRGAVSVVQPGSPPTTVSLTAGTTVRDLQQRQHVSTRYGLPNLSPFVVLRFAAQPIDEGVLELCTAQIGPTIVNLPWEQPASR